jgi:hypothetical protein
MVVFSANADAGVKQQDTATQQTYTEIKTCLFQNVCYNKL